MIQCYCCEKSTSNPKYCSRSCAAKINNKLIPKRNPQGSCKICSINIKTREVFCSTQCKEESKRRSAERKKKYLSSEQYKKNKNQKTVDWRRRVKLKGIQLMGGKCQGCGLVDHPCVYDFHHKNPSQKDFAISSSGNCRSWDRIKAELKKCILLCSNCHRKEHHSLDGISD